MSLVSIFPSKKYWSPIVAPFYTIRVKSWTREKSFISIQIYYFAWKFVSQIYCITLLKRIFFKILLCKNKNPNNWPFLASKHHGLNTLKSTRYKKFHSKFVLYQLHSSREKHFFGEKKFHHISFIFVLLSL